MTRPIAFTLLGVVPFVAAACGSPAHETPSSSPPVSVQTVLAAATDVAERLEAGGVVAASESALVSSRMVGTVLTVHVRAGDRVSAGDALVTLDARDVAAAARQARAAAVAAERGLTLARDDQAATAAEYKLATAWHGRIAVLRDKSAATAQEYDEAEARLSAAAARASAAQAGVEQASARIDAMRAAADAAAITESFTVVRAPFDGIVTERLTDPGNLATPGTPLVRVDAGGARRIEVRVDEARARYVRPGDRVVVLLDQPADPAAGLRGDVDGMVTEVARAVASDQHAFTVKVGLPDDVAPVIGSFARVRFRGEARRVLTVPIEAVRRQGQVTSVLVVQDGIARLRLVQAGVVTGDQVEILAGLDAGEAVITAPPPSLIDGRPVTVTAQQASGGSRQ